jgi:hypothetical protein
MKNKYSKALSNLFAGRYKAQDKQFRTQKEVIYNSIKDQAKTMLMIFIDTGIVRANVCRRIAELQEENRVKLVYKTFCKATGRRAGYYISTVKNK